MSYDAEKDLSDRRNAEKSFENYIELALKVSEPLHSMGVDYMRNLFDNALKSHVEKMYLLPVADRASLSREQLLRRELKPKHRKMVLERDKYRCTNCNSHKNLCVDHKTPISKGGDNHESNLQTLCRSCNCKKRNKTMAEWLGGTK